MVHWSAAPASRLVSTSLLAKVVYSTWSVDIIIALIITNLSNVSVTNDSIGAFSVLATGAGIVNSLQADTGSRLI